MLDELHNLYRVIVWESTSMLALCSTDCSVGTSDLFGNELLKSLQNRGTQISSSVEQQTEHSAANANANAVGTLFVPIAILYETVLKTFCRFSFGDGY